MELTLKRNPSTDECTTGDLLLDGEFECYTLEDVVREVPGQPVAAWKVHGRTAIPAGRYRVTLETSPRFGADTITLHDVPGFSGVRIHGGNTAADTEGCPMVGDRVQNNRIVAGTSQPALKRLKDKLRAALRDGGEAWLTIENA